MIKEDLVAVMAEAGDIKKTQAEKSLSALGEAVRAALAKGEKVVLPGIGTLCCAQRRARTGRNPRTGEEIHIPAKTAVKFSPATAMKEKLNAAKK